MHGRIKVIVTVVVSCLAVYVGLSSFGASASMKVPRLPVEGTPASVGLAYQNVSFNSRVDKVKLNGWFLPANGDAVIVIVHGGYQNRLDPVVKTLDLANSLVKDGYNLLLFDLRGRGESAGTGYSLSNMNKDIGGAIDYLKNKGFPASKIGIIGFCSGAAETSIFASRNQVGGLVLDGCFTSVQGMVENQATKYGIPRLPVSMFLPGVRLAARVFYGYQPVNPINAVPKISCPILFIHEQYDNLISLADDIALRNATGNPADTLWQVPNAEHSQSYATHPAEYVSRVTSFFQKALDTPH